MNNHNISPRNNQAFSKQYISLVYWMGGSLSGYGNYKPLSIPHEFTYIRQRILQVIIRYCGIYQNVYMSQDRIAQISNCHHDTVLRNIKLFVELGILKKKYRGANRTCEYSLTSFFHNQKVQWALRDIIPNLYWSIKSAVRRCQTMLSGIISSITARLSNDKNKRINTYKKIEKNNNKEEKYDLVYNSKPLIYEKGPNHDKLFKEFSSILGIG